MIDQNRLNIFNKERLNDHKKHLSFLSETLIKKGIDVKKLLNDISDFQVAIPSWALGTGGTRFGRFPQGGEPASLEDKIKDVGVLHALNRSSGAISLHIPWDTPKNHNAVKKLAKGLGIKFDAVNSNTFQDQSKNIFSYKCSCNFWSSKISYCMNYSYTIMI